MNAAILLLALLPSADRQGGIVVRVGPRVQNRAFILGDFGRTVKIRGNNNIVYFHYAPDAGYNYYSKQKYVNRRPAFWRFRRNYPR